MIFPGQLDSLDNISKFVVQAAKDAGLDENAAYAVDLAVSEACANIIEHSYGGEGKGDITCTCIVTDDGLTITLEDTGRPFNPKNIPVPKVGVKLKDVKPRGAGIFLIRKMMDEVHFDFSKKTGNSLTMTKKKTSGL
jgi:serine/threonine-protein kinase RsbW